MRFIRLSFKKKNKTKKTYMYRPQQVLHLKLKIYFDSTFSLVYELTGCLNSYILCLQTKITMSVTKLSKSTMKKSTFTPTTPRELWCGPECQDSHGKCYVYIKDQFKKKIFCPLLAQYLNF